MNKPQSHTSLLVANWKLNPTSLKQAKALNKKIISDSAKLRNVAIVLCPPTIYLQPLKDSYRGMKIQYGAQNIYSATHGAHTGELSPTQLTDLKINYVILGHSERRAPLKNGGAAETNEIVSHRIRVALENSLAPIVCIGEEVRSREGEHLHFIEEQLVQTLRHVPVTKVSEVILAYEPLWAIGGKNTGRVITAHDLYEMMLFIRKVLTKQYGKSVATNTKILYGGSVKPENVLVLATEGNMDGFLVGGASLDPQSFIEIASTLNSITK